MAGLLRGSLDPSREAGEEAGPSDAQASGERYDDGQAGWLSFSTAAPEHSTATSPCQSTDNCEIQLRC